MTQFFFYVIYVESFSKIEARAGSTIDRLQFTFGFVKADSHGAESGNPRPDCVILEGDVINQIRLSWSEFRHADGHPYIQRLEFSTRESTVCDFCGSSACNIYPFTDIISHPGYHLSYLSGYDDWYPLKSGNGQVKVVNFLRFHWKRDNTLKGRKMSIGVCLIEITHTN